MDLSRTRVVLRERAVVDILDLALRFVVDNGVLYAKTALVAIPPFFIASVVIARAGGWFATWTFALFAATFAAAPFTLLASRLVFEDDVRASPALKEALRATPRLLALRVVTFVAGTLGLIMLVLPGIPVLALTLFAVEVVLLERAATTAAVLRSASIAWRASGQAIMALLLLTCLHFVAVVTADTAGRTVITALLEARAPESMWTEGWSYLSLLGFWLFVPYAATARFFVYLDVRTRSEGWDIRTRFMALAARDAGGLHDVRRAA